MHRGLGEIKELINSADLNQNVKNLAVRIFENIALAESKMHGIDVEKIHFHEVGAIDSIIDIVGAAICYDYLKIDKCYVSKIPVSFSFIKTAHGKWPNPAPASIELLKNFTLTQSGIEKELVTPTGAAIIKSLCDPLESAPPDFILERVGYGAGYYGFEHPNVLRIMTGEKKNSVNKIQIPVSLTESARELDCGYDEIDMLRANIDDMAPEYFDYLINELMASGALDVSIHQILMKKGRPAFELAVMAPPSLSSSLSEIIFELTTTIGLRIERIPRLILHRKSFSCEVSHGVNIPVKVSYLKGRIHKIKPESDALKKFALDNKMSVSAARDFITSRFLKDQRA